MINPNKIKHLKLALSLLAVSFVIAFYDHLLLPSGLAFKLVSAMPWIFLFPTILGNALYSPRLFGLGLTGVMIGLYVQFTIVAYVGIFIFQLIRGKRVKRTGERATGSS